jgi:hypothetical protein
MPNGNKGHEAAHDDEPAALSLSFRFVSATDAGEMILGVCFREISS